MVTENQIIKHRLNKAYCGEAQKASDMFTKENLPSNIRGKGERKHTANDDSLMGQCAMLACCRHLFGMQGREKFWQAAHQAEMIPLQRKVYGNDYISDGGIDIPFLMTDVKSSQRNKKELLDHYAIVNRREYHEGITYVFCIVEDPDENGGRIVNICGWSTSEEVKALGPFDPPHEALSSFKGEYATQIKNINPMTPMNWTKI